MGVFQRTASSSSTASSSKPTPKAKAPKPSKPSLVQRVSSTMKPTPKPQPSLLRRATTSLSEFDSSSWEKRTLRSLQKFPEDHPLLMRLIGTGLCVVGAGAGAITVPGLMAALGIKLAVVNGVGAASVAGATALQGAAVAGTLAAGAKVLLSTLAMDLGGRMMVTPASPVRTSTGFFGRRARRASSTIPSEIALPFLSR